MNIRRKKLKLYNNNRVSVPMDPTTENIKKYLLLDVQEGKY